MRGQLQWGMRPAEMEIKEGAMSAPETPIEKQKKRHKPALLGMRAVLIFVAILFLGLIIGLAYNGQAPVEPDVRIDGRTGQDVETE